MFSLPSINAMNDGIGNSSILEKDKALFYEFVELLEKARNDLINAEDELQASYHVLYDIEHDFEDDETFKSQLKILREEIAKVGHSLRKKNTELKKAEVVAWFLHKNQEKKKKKKKAGRKKKTV